MSNNRELTEQRLIEILHDISHLRAGVVGDVSLDVYWRADMQLSELSRETPHYTLPIKEEIYAPGAAGNVANNLKKIGCREVFLCSIIGADWRGGQLEQALQLADIDLSYMLTEGGWITPSYCKPIRVGLQNVQQEDARLDFNNYSLPTDAMVERFIAKIDQMAEQVDVIAVTDQMKYGVIGEAVRRCLQRWMEQGKIIVVDSRERIHLFPGMMIKPNEIELIRYYDIAQRKYELYTIAEWSALALRMAGEMKASCIVTLGAGGSIWAQDGKTEWVPSLPAQEPIDIVGAGDSFAAALLASLGAGADGAEAMMLGHYAAAISIQQLGCAGTASKEDIMTMYHHIKKPTELTS